MFAYHVEYGIRISAISVYFWEKDVDKLNVFGSALLDVYLLKNQRNSKLLDFKVSILYRGALI